MDAPTAVVLAAALSTVAAVLSSVITSRVAGRASKTSALLEWAKQLQESERAARSEASGSRDRADRIRDETDEDVAKLRTEIDQLHGRLREASGMADRLADTLASVQSEVWRPQPDIPALRKLVGRPSTGLNGR